MSTLEPADRPHHHDHAYYEDLVSGAALGILTPTEHASLMAYLDTERGAVLWDDLADFMEVAAVLPLGMDEASAVAATATATATPSAGLRDRVLASISAEGGMHANPAADAPAATMTTSVAGTPPVALDSRRAAVRAGSRTGRTPAADGDRSPSIFDAAPEELTTIPTPVPIGRQLGFTRNRSVMRVLAAIALVALLSGAVFGGYQLAERNRPAGEDMMSIALDFATPLPSGVVANLQYDPKSSLLMLSTTNMPAAPADHVYQVWLIGANGPQSVGTMGPGGFAMMMDTSKEHYQTLAITVEPGPSGSPGPTTQPIVVASLKDLPTS